MAGRSRRYPVVSDDKAAGDVAAVVVVERHARLTEQALFILGQFLQEVLVRVALEEAKAASVEGKERGNKIGPLKCHTRTKSGYSREGGAGLKDAWTSQAIDRMARVPSRSVASRRRRR